MSTVTMALSKPVNPTYGYGEIAPVYAKRGFLPIPLNGKVIAPISGATGYRGTVTPAKIEQWRSEFGHCNTGLRLPLGLLGIDDDEEGSTPQLDALKALLGPLPQTVTSTARGQLSTRRTHLYRVPDSTFFVANPKVPGVETKDVHIDIISLSNRYLAVAPSVHPETGASYEWFAANGNALGAAIPAPEDFAELPETWVDYLAKIPSARDGDAGAYAGALDLEAWLGEGTPEEWGNDLILEIGKANHIGHSGLFGFVNAIHLLRELHEPGLAQVNRVLYQRFLDTSSDKNSVADLERELSNVWRYVLGENWKPEPLGIPLRAWAISANARAKLRLTFWDSRPVLKHCQESAFKTLLSPWSLFGALAQRALLDIPYNVVYKSNRGGASLNNMCAFVGVTGMGKTLTQGVLDDAYEMPGDKWRCGLREAGSGEGIMDAYRQWGKDADGVKELQWINPNHALQFGFDEVGSLTGKQARQGTTLFEAMKSAESGSSLTRVLSGGGGSELPKGEYRFCLFVNVQPAKAGDLFDDSAVSGGLPGRFLWFSTQNETVAEDYIDGPVTKYTVPRVDWTGKREIHALPDMLEAHKADAILAHKNERDELDSHSVLTRAKVAVALMTLDGRSYLIQEDWELSGVVMDHSNETRAGIQAALKSAGMQAIQRMGKVQGHRNSVAKEVEEEREIQKVAARITDLRNRGKKDTGQGGVKQSLRSDQRKYFAEAVALLEEQQKA